MKFWYIHVCEQRNSQICDFFFYFYMEFVAFLTILMIEWLKLFYEILNFGHNNLKKICNFLWFFLMYQKRGLSAIVLRKFRHRLNCKRRRSHEHKYQAYTDTVVRLHRIITDFQFLFNGSGPPRQSLNFGLYMKLILHLSLIFTLCICMLRWKSQ